jgi:ankyrin repeat protein
LICGGQGKLTVLMVAAKWARVETVKVLLARGAKLNAIDEVRALSTLSR